MYSVPEFIQGIVTDNPAYDLTHNFGKMMVLYRLLGGIPGITISTTHEDGTGFAIKTKTKREASSVNEYMNGVRYVVYGNGYNVSTYIQEDKCIKVKISKI